MLKHEQHWSEKLSRVKTGDSGLLKTELNVQAIKKTDVSVTRKALLMRILGGETMRIVSEAEKLKMSK